MFKPPHLCILVWQPEPTNKAGTEDHRSTQETQVPNKSDRGLSSKTPENISTVYSHTPSKISQTHMEKGIGTDSKVEHPQSGDGSRTSARMWRSASSWCQQHRGPQWLTPRRLTHSNRRAQLSSLFFSGKPFSLPLVHHHYRGSSEDTLFVREPSL